MGEQEKLKMICSECGHCPVDMGGSVAVYTNRVRRRVLWVWVGLVFLLGVLALPWVQVRLGNDWAVFDWQANQGKIADRPLASPPVRWRDLERAANGDIGSVHQFRESLSRILPTSEVIPKAFDEYTFQIGTAQVERYGGDPVDGLVGAIDGELIPFTLVGYRVSRIGWPMDWFMDVRWDRYGYGSARFGDDRLLSVEDDMVHRSTTTRMIDWGNVGFIFLVCVGAGVFVRWLFLWRGVGRRRAMLAGVVMSALFVGVVLIVGSRHRVVTDWDTLMGRFDPVLAADRVVWKREVLDEFLTTDDRTQELARLLVEGFGEMTHPNELVIVGLTRHAGFDSHDWSYGLFDENLFIVGSSSFVRFEPDGTTSRMRLPDLENRLFRVHSDGVVDVGWSGRKNEIGYGVSVNIRNLVLFGVGLWVVWRVLLCVGWWWYRRIQGRRVGRSVCVWCEYPCGGE